MTYEDAHKVRCPKCERYFVRKLSRHRLCWVCWMESRGNADVALAELAWERGYEVGYSRGYAEGRR